MISVVNLSNNREWLCAASIDTQRERQSKQSHMTLRGFLEEAHTKYMFSNRHKSF